MCQTDVMPCGRDRCGSVSVTCHY